MSREIKGGIVVEEEDVVIVSNQPTKKGGWFAKVGTTELVKGDALVGLHPVVKDESKNKSLTGKLLPNLSPENSVLLTEDGTEFVEGKSISITLPNKIDKLRHRIGKKLLGW